MRSPGRGRAVGVVIPLLAVMVAALASPSIAATATFQPDVVNTFGGGGYDIYEVTPVQQVWTRSVYPGRKQAFKVYVGNDGDASDTFVFKGCTSGPDFEIRFWQQGLGSPTEVTDEVVAGTFTWGPIGPGSSTGVFKTSMSASRHPDKRIRSCTLLVASQADPAKLDAVKFRLRVRHRA